MIRALFLLAAMAATALEARAEGPSIVVSSTTSTQDSGLFGYLLPRFKEATGIDVKVVAQGTGQALDTGRRCDADVVFVHARALEDKFMAEGYGVKRYDVMYNDFVLVGPKADPAGAKSAGGVLAALKAIDDKQASFISRGDRSGTHTAELALWKAANLDPAGSRPAWYKQIGQGMGAALNAAQATGAYTLSDRGTWISFKNKGDLVILVEGDKQLFNQYGVIPVNPEKCPNVKKAEGQAFADWLVSDAGQKTIASYQIDGQQLFFPDAKR
jgi:tungstate transport system substrate-binding protein